MWDKRQFYLYDTKSQQQLHQGALYCKVRTIQWYREYRKNNNHPVSKHFGDSGKKNIPFNRSDRSQPPAPPSEPSWCPCFRFLVTVKMSLHLSSTMCIHRVTFLSCFWEAVSWTLFQVFFGRDMQRLKIFLKPSEALSFQYNLKWFYSHGKSRKWVHEHTGSFLGVRSFTLAWEWNIPRLSTSQWICKY